MSLLRSARNDTTFHDSFRIPMWLRKKDEVEKLIAELAFWKPKAVRREAIRELGAIGDARAVKPLIKALRSWNEDIRNEAIKALIKIGMPSVELLIQTLLQTLQSTYITTF